MEREETSLGPPPRQEGNKDVSTSVPAQDQQGKQDEQETESSHLGPRPKTKIRRKRSTVPRTGTPADKSPSARSEPESVRERTQARDLRQKRSNTSTRWREMVVYPGRKASRIDKDKLLPSTEAVSFDHSDRKRRWVSAFSISHYGVLEESKR